MPKKDDPFPSNVSRGSVDWGPVFKAERAMLDGEIEVVSSDRRTAHRSDPDFLAYIASQECWARDCGTPCLGDVVAHHSPTKGSGRWDDRKTVPLCAAQHHTEIHQRGCLGRWDIAETDAQIHRAQIHHLCNYLDGQ